MITQNRKKANHFNYVFSNLGKFFGSVSHQHYIPGKSEIPLTHYSQHITVKPCYDVLQELKIRKTLGPSTAIIDGQSIILTHFTFVINDCRDEKSFHLNKRKQK